MTLFVSSPPPSPDNVPEYSVGDISRSLKNTVETRYANVRVRGEISGFKVYGGGTFYFALKDTDAVLDAVCWPAQAARLGIRPEEGLEVICTGRLTTYPGRSKYQLVVERMEPAGEGALLKQLEERRRRLAAEGLFDKAKKQPLPFLPNCIGLITSPTGAVLQDILHRLRDRFPTLVLLWPVVVQGDTAPAQIAAAIAGFNALPLHGPIQRPDVLIVARGGGSLEDLWCFNDEQLVRAAAASRIPLISAVGHETDTTLIDHAADVRAPTPTAAAEMVVPVRLTLLAEIEQRRTRLISALIRCQKEKATTLAALWRALPPLSRFVEERRQRLDDRSERLKTALPQLIKHRHAYCDVLAARLHPPQHLIAGNRHTLYQSSTRLLHATRTIHAQAHSAVQQRAARLQPSRLVLLGEAQRDMLSSLKLALHRSGTQIIPVRRDRVDQATRLIESFSYKSVLARGFAVIRMHDGTPLSSVHNTTDGQRLDIELSDGIVPVTVNIGPSPTAPKRKKITQSASFT